jgi:hypothetical protein
MDIVASEQRRLSVSISTVNTTVRSHYLWVRHSRRIQDEKLSPDVLTQLLEKRRSDREVIVRPDRLLHLCDNATDQR